MIEGSLGLRSTSTPVYRNTSLRKDVSQDSLHFSSAVVIGQTRPRSRHQLWVGGARNLPLKSLPPPLSSAPRVSSFTSTPQVQSRWVVSPTFLNSTGMLLMNKRFWCDRCPAPIVRLVRCCILVYLVIVVYWYSLHKRIFSYVDCTNDELMNWHLFFCIAVTYFLLFFGLAYLS